MWAVWHKIEMIRPISPRRREYRISSIVSDVRIGGSGHTEATVVAGYPQQHRLENRYRFSHKARCENSSLGVFPARTHNSIEIALRAAPEADLAHFVLPRQLTQAKPHQGQGSDQSRPYHRNPPLWPGDRGRYRAPWQAPPIRHPPRHQRFLSCCCFGRHHSSFSRKRRRLGPKPAPSPRLPPPGRPEKTRLAPRARFHPQPTRLSQPR